MRHAPHIQEKLDECKRRWHECRWCGKKFDREKDWRAHERFCWHRPAEWSGEPVADPGDASFPDQGS